MPYCNIRRLAWVLLLASCDTQPKAQTAAPAPDEGAHVGNQVKQTQPAAKTRLYPREGTTVDLSSLEFEREEDRRRHRRLREMIVMQANNKDWAYARPLVLGNFIGEYWTRGDGNLSSGHGVGSAFTGSPGVAWYTLDLLHYELPNVFGLSFGAGNSPAGDGLYVSASYAVRGKRILGSNCQISFAPTTAGKRGEVVPIVGAYLPLPQGYVVQGPNHSGENLVPPQPTELSCEQRFAAALNDPGARALSELSLLEPVIDEVFAKHQIKRVEYGEYEGRGIPPTKTFVDLKQDEEAAVRRQLLEKLGAWTTQVTTHRDDLKTSLLELMPHTQIWDGA